MSVSHPAVSVREWLTANMAKYPDKNRCCAVCAKVLNVTEKRARAVYRELKGGGRMASKSTTSGKPIGLSVSKFVQKYDFEAKLRETIKKMCGNQFVSDIDIRAACGIPPGVYRRVTELPEFADCQVKENGRIWWSTSENVRKVREKQKQWGLVGSI